MTSTPGITVRGWGVARFGVVGALAFAGAACAQPVLLDLGVPPEYDDALAYDVSADGSVVVGYLFGDANGMSAFRWTAVTGIQDIGRLPGALWSRATAVSADGAVIVGESGNFGFRWTSTGGMHSIGTLPGGATSWASAASADGSVIVGSSYMPLGNRAVRWTGAGGLQNLGVLPGTSRSSATDVSADGSIVIGSSDVSASFELGFMWTAPSGMIDLGLLPQTHSTHARAVSADGRVVVGAGQGEDFIPYRWTAATGLVVLGNVPGGAGAFDVNQDGSSIVGRTDEGPFLWTRERGMVDLRTYLASLGTSFEDWGMIKELAISADGTAIVGYGHPATTFWRRRAWLVTGVPRSCYADCTADSTLTVADFGCFQTRFMAGDLYADCDEDGSIAVPDFACFQTGFVAGCR